MHPDAFTFFCVLLGNDFVKNPYRLGSKGLLKWYHQHKSSNSSNELLRNLLSETRLHLATMKISQQEVLDFCNKIILAIKVFMHYPVLLVQLKRNDPFPFGSLKSGEYMAMMGTHTGKAGINDGLIKSFGLQAWTRKVVEHAQSIYKGWNPAVQSNICKRIFSTQVEASTLIVFPQSDKAPQIVLENLERVPSSVLLLWLEYRGISITQNSVKDRKDLESIVRRAAHIEQCYSNTQHVPFEIRDPSAVRVDIYSPVQIWKPADETIEWSSADQVCRCTVEELKPPNYQFLRETYKDKSSSTLSASFPETNESWASCNICLPV